LHSTIPRLEHQLHDLEEADETTSGPGKKKKRLLAEAVTADAISTIVARHTGIPVSRITGSESKKLLKMEDKLRERVVGQDHALEAVSNCVRLARTRLQDRTLGNFLFLGPSGVGSEHVCLILLFVDRIRDGIMQGFLAEFIFDDPNAIMTRIDMSEFWRKAHGIEIDWSATGLYVGYDQGGVLTEYVRRRPYQAILLDEFEKGHPEVWNVLLQLFDEGNRGAKWTFRM
jgi:ATP-dependent Clp protease ATP-binding subunit ClpB